MREQRGILIPETDKTTLYGKNYEIREYNNLKLKGNLAVDIGAHVGIWSLRLANDFRQVMAFEPMKKHIVCHKVNCKDFDNILLHEVALSNENTNKIMTTKENNSGMSTLIDQKKLKWKKEQFTEIVETRMLDSYDLQEVDFIKIDVEGWEEQVLKGAYITITRCKPIIYIEIWKHNYSLISEILLDMGYSIEKKSFQNYLCKPNGR